MLRFWSLKTRLLGSFAALGFVAASATGLLSYESARTSLERASFNALTIGRDIKKRQVEGYVRQLRSQAITFAESAVVLGTFDAPLEAGGVLAGRAREAMRSYAEHLGYTDILLLDCPGATPRVALRGRSEALRAGPSRIATRACTATETRRAYLTDFAPGERASDPPLAYVAAPVQRGAERVGVALFEVPVQELNRIMAGDRNWRREGFGETGETYLVGDDLTMRTDSRFFLEDAPAFLGQLAHTGVDADVRRAIVAASSTILALPVHTDAAREAQAGRTDTRVLADYRAIPVLSSFAPLDIDDVRWSIISEVDVSEAFAATRQLRETLRLMGVCTALFFAVVGSLLARGIAGPVDRLARVARRFGDGDLRARIPDTGGDELGALATAFNGMAERLAEREQQLRAENEERRALEHEVLTIAEGEQRRIGQDLHDGLSQQLLGLAFFARTITQQLEARGAPEFAELGRVSSLLEQAVETARDLSHGLSPVAFVKSGIVYALRELAASSASLYGIECRCGQLEPFDLDDLDRGVNLYRIAQEAVANAVRHGRARRVEISLVREGGEGVLTVRNDGEAPRAREAAQVAPRRGMGVHIMGLRARALGGALSLVALPEGGANLECRWPDVPAPKLVADHLEDG